MTRVLVPLLLAATAWAQPAQWFSGPGRGVMGSQNPAQPPGPGDGVIEGTVHNKMTGEPIRRATVSMGVPNGQLMAATDDAGHFTFRALPYGTYWMNVQAQGYTPNAGRPMPVLQTNNQVRLDQNTTHATVDLFLYPTGAISGHVFNDAGEPVHNCQIAVLRQQMQRGRLMMMPAGFANTNASGEYRAQGLQRGHYTLSAQCHGTTVLPHPFMKRNDPAIPRLMYAPQYFGGSDTQTAQKVNVGTGSNLEGIDIRVHRVQAARLEGVVSGIPPEDNGVMLSLTRSDESQTNTQRYSTAVNPRTGRFTFPTVAPGEYRLTAIINDGKRFLRAEETVDLKPNVRNETAVALAPLPQVSGTVTDAPPPRDANITYMSRGNHQIYFEPLDPQQIMPQTMAPLDKDGSFRLPAGLPAGHWRVHVNGPYGYVKSMQVDGNDVSPSDFIIAPGTPHNVQIALGSDFGELDVTVEGASGAQSGVGVLAIADDGKRIADGSTKNVPVQQDGAARINMVEPGRYRVFALPQQLGWILSEDEALIEHFRDRGKSVDVEADGKAQVTVSPINADEIGKVLDESE